MAVRGAAFINYMGSFYEGVIQFSWTYRGFSHADEEMSGSLDVDASMLTNMALKAAMKTAIVDWYAGHESENWDPWNTLLDTFGVVSGGIL